VDIELKESESKDMLSFRQLGIGVEKVFREWNGPEKGLHIEQEDCISRKVPIF